MSQETRHSPVLMLPCARSDNLQLLLASRLHLPFFVISLDNNIYGIKDLISGHPCSPRCLLKSYLNHSGIRTRIISSSVPGIVISCVVLFDVLVSITFSDSNFDRGQPSQPKTMKRKGDQLHVQAEGRIDSLDKENILAILEELSGAGYEIRKSDVSSDRITGISPTKMACTEHRKRVRSVSSTDSEQFEDVRNSHSSSAIGNEPMEHQHHHDHTISKLCGLPLSAHELIQASGRSLTGSSGLERTCTEPHSSAQRRESASTDSSLSSPSDSEPTTPTQISLEHNKGPRILSVFENSIIRESLIEVAAPAHTSMHYRKGSAAHSEIHFHEHHLEKKDSQIIFNDVLDLIKSPIKSSSKRSPSQEGYIYVLHDPAIPGFVKIGQTTQCPTQRKKQIATCSKLTVDFVGSERLIKTAYYDRLEQIIHADLWNERHYFECACSAKRNHAGAHENDTFTKHGEWFKIDAEEAGRRVEMWRKWMRQEPYKKPGSAGAGELKLDFRRRADYCCNLPVSGRPDERWETFMAPFYMAEVDQNTFNWLS